MAQIDRANKYLLKCEPFAIFGTIPFENGPQIDTTIRKKFTNSLTVD